METAYLTVLSAEEQQNLVGGGWLGCLASGALFMVGVADLNPVIVLSALIAADKTC
jgi:hypothetical protein